MRSCFALLFILFVAASAGAQEAAWWVTATFEPRDETVEGLPVAQLHPDWVKASALREADLPPGAQEEGWRMADFRFALAVEADLDGDGVPERAVVGVYQHRSGTRGRFLLILGQKTFGTGWAKRALFSSEGEAGFSAVGFFEGRFLWVTCFACDVGCEVQYRWWRFSLKCYSCCSASAGSRTSQSTGPELALLASAGDRGRSAVGWQPSAVETLGRARQ